MPQQEKTAAEMMVDLLVDRWGVRHVFGLRGDGINGIMEVLRKRRDPVHPGAPRGGRRLRRRVR